MRKFYWILIVASLLLAACAATVEDITPVIEVPTATLTPIPPTVTVEPTNTPTIIPSPTPTQPISEEGLYMVFQISSEPVRFVMLHEDGVGRREIELPKGKAKSDIELPQGVVIPPASSQTSISPIVEWEVFYSGVEWGDSGSNYPYLDIQIHIMNLDTKQIVDIAYLISDQFPDNLMQVAEAMPTEGDFAAESAQEWLPYVERDFVYSILWNYAWSPDGQSLAFAAQLDGPSSDVYIYDLSTQEIRSVVNDLKNVVNISWSPNGKRIAFANSVPLLDYGYNEFYTVELETGEIHGPLGRGRKGWWLGNDSFKLVQTFDGGPPLWTTVDAITGEVIIDQPLSEGTISGYLEEGYQMISSTDISEGIWGTIFYQEGKRVAELPNLGFNMGSFIDHEKYLYAGSGRFSGISGVYLITRDFEVELLASELGDYPLITFSQNRKWFIIENNEKELLNYVYYGNDLLFAFEGYFSKIIWRWGTNDFYLVSGNSLYLYTLPSGEKTLIYQCEYEGCGIDAYGLYWLYLEP